MTTGIEYDKNQKTENDLTQSIWLWLSMSDDFVSLKSCYECSQLKTMGTLQTWMII